LVAGNVWEVITENFSDGVDTSSFGEISPEVLGNIRDSVDSEGVKIISLDEVSNPLEESLLNEGMILIKIRESTKPASFHSVRVHGTNLFTFRILVVVAGVVERNNSGVVPVINISNVVGNDVNHDPHVSLVASTDEFLELFSCAELFVDLIEVAGPVAMISSLSVSNNW